MLESPVATPIEVKLESPQSFLLKATTAFVIVGKTYYVINRIFAKIGNEKGAKIAYLIYTSRSERSI